MNVWVLTGTPDSRPGSVLGVFIDDESAKWAADLPSGARWVRTERGWWSRGASIGYLHEITRHRIQ